MMIMCCFWLLKRSGRDRDIRFCRIPKVSNSNRSHGHGTTLSQAGFLRAICRGSMLQKVQSNDRICSRHYVTGKVEALEDHANPDWLLFSELLVSTKLYFRSEARTPCRMKSFKSTFYCSYNNNNCIYRYSITKLVCRTQCHWPSLGEDL